MRSFTSVFILVLSCLVAPLSASSEESTTLQEALEEALSLLEDGEVSAAESALAELIRISDDLAPAWAGLAAVHGMREEWAASAEHAWAARALDPENPLAATLLCRAEVNRGNLQQATLACRDAIRLDVTEVLAWRGACTAALARHRWQEAAEVCGGGAQRFPDEVGLLWRQGVALGRLGRFANANAVCTRAVEVAPEEPMSHYCAGTVALEEGRARAALPHCERAVALESTHALARYCRGMAHLALSQIELAEADCQEAVRRAPSEPLAHFCLGRIAHAKRDWSGTGQHMQRALELNSELVEARGSLADALARGGDPEAGERIVRELLATSESAPRRAQLAGMLQDQERWDEAVAEWNRALEGAPERAAWWHNLALAHHGRGDSAAFLSSLSRAQQAEPSEVRWAVAHVEGALLVRAHEDAVSAAEEALDHHPTDVRLLEGRCQGLVRLQRWEEAERICLRAAAAEGAGGIAQRELGVVLLSTQRAEEAVEAFRAAIRRGTDDAATRTNLGNALLRVGDHAAAVEVLRGATRSTGASALSHHLLGNALRETGDARGSREALCRAAQMAPENARFVEACEAAR